MKVGETIHLGTLPIYSPNSPAKYQLIAARKYPLHFFEQIKTPLPACAIIIDGNQLPKMGLLNIKINPFKWGWCSLPVLGEFIAKKKWAFCNSQKILPSIKELQHKIKFVNEMNEITGGGTFKHKLSLYCLIDEISGLPLDEDMFVNPAVPTGIFQPAKLAKLSSYSQALPLP